MCKTTYPSLPFTRLVPSGFLQSSPTPASDPIPDESFSVPYTSRYTLGFSNDGPHTGRGQFFLTLQPTPYLSSKYVALGTVVCGGEELERACEGKESVNERPAGEWKVVEGGEWDGKAAA